MPKLTTKYLDELKLNKIDPATPKPVEMVRRQGNAYAVDTAGKIIAVSFPENKLREISIGEECSELEHIYMAYQENLEVVNFEVELPKLVHLYLNNCKLKRLTLPANMRALRQVYVQNNGLEELEFGGECPELELLDGSGNGLSKFSSPPGFPKLTYLYLRQNKINNLDLSQALPALNFLDLRENQLEELPLSLLRSVDLEALYVNENPFSRFKKDVLNDDGDGNSKEGVFKYLASLIEDDVKEYDQVKLIVLGNSTAGKTSLINFLQDRSYIKGRDSTHGMVPIIWSMADNCKVAVWDFGGQEYYHNIHHLFFTDQCLYLVLFESETNKNGTLPTKIKIYGQAEPIIEDLQHFHYKYWLDNIDYLTAQERQDAKSLDVIMVQNKFELTPGQKIEGANYSISVEKAYEAIQEKRQEEDEYWSDFRSFEIRLKHHLQRIRGQVPVSTKWLEIKNEVQKLALAGMPLLTFEAFVDLASAIKTDINQKSKEGASSELDILLGTFIKSGVVLYYPDVDPDHIFISPGWLADGIYRVLDYEVKKENGKFSLAHVESVLAVWETEDPILAKTQLDSRQLIGIMRKLDLIYELNPEHNPEECKDGEVVFIAPQYLPLECPEPKNVTRIKKNLLDQGLGPHFSLYYPTFLPKSTMPRFISRFGEWATQPCWRHGIIYEVQQMEVLVECEFDKNLIHFWIKPNDHKPELVRSIFENFCDIDKNKDIQISRNQRDFVRIGTLLKHPFGENNKIESVNGDLLEAEDFAEFIQNGMHERKTIFSPIFIQDMYGIEQEIKGLKEILDRLIDKKVFLQKEQTSAYDSEKRYALSKSIEALEDDIKKYRKQLADLKTNAEVEIEPQQASQLQQLIEKTDELQVEVLSIGQKLSSILSQLSAQDQQLLAIREASESHKAELVQLFVYLDKTPANDYEIQILLGQINEMLVEHQEALPAAVAEHLKQLNSAKPAEYTDVKGKLKLKIPIIPTILEYEKELSWDLRNMAKQIWSDLKAGKVFLK
jgi:GTPase SAR1 family protein